MLHLPSSWPHWTVWAVFAILLAALDLAMATAATMVLRTRGTQAVGAWAALGILVAVALFWVVASSLAYGDMVEMNVLWIGALLALVPLVNAGMTGEWPSARVLAGLAGMVACVAVVEWPAA